MHAYFVPNLKKENFKSNFFKNNKLDEKYLSELSLKLSNNYEYFSKDKIILDKEKSKLIDNIKKISDDNEELKILISSAKEGLKKLFQ